MIRREGDRLVRRAQNLDRGPGAVHERRRTADVDIGGTQLEDRAGVDHQSHALWNVESDAVWQSLPRQGGADLVGRVLLVSYDADDRLAARSGGVGRIDGSNRRSDRAVGRGDRAVARADERLVDEHSLARGRRVEPEAERAARLTVPVAVERSATRVDDRIRRHARRLETEFELIVSIGPAAVAGVGNLRVEGVVAGARDAEEVGAGSEVEPEEGIAAERIVVAGDHLAATRHRIDPVKREQAVELARVVKRLAGPRNDRLG